MTPPDRIPASTLVIFRRGADAQPPELLMVQRAKAMRFAGGAAVFPGGRIDPEDHALARRIATGLDPLQAAARIAGIRETLEETGLALGMAAPVSAEEALAARQLLERTGALAPVLDRFGWTLDLDQLVPFARWCPNWKGGFDTHFFLADLGTGAVDIAIDRTENTRLFWTSAARALAMGEAGEIEIIFPTRRNLERLAQFGSFAEAREHALGLPPRTITPRKVDRDGVAWLTIPEGFGYPVLGEPMDGVMRGFGG